LTVRDWSSTKDGKHFSTSSFVVPLRQPFLCGSHEDFAALIFPAMAQSGRRARSRDAVKLE
jgi:hypothetical protein